LCEKYSERAAEFSDVVQDRPPARPREFREADLGLAPLRICSEAYIPVWP
jgi:hypothetical protein